MKRETGTSLSTARAWNGIEYIGKYSFGEKISSTDYDASEDLEFERSTGLADDDGKPIYEGDLCKCSFSITHGPEDSGVWECFWDAESASFLFDRQLEYSFLEIQKIKVVGNVNESKGKI